MEGAAFPETGLSPALLHPWQPCGGSDRDSGERRALGAHNHGWLWSPFISALLFTEDARYPFLSLLHRGYLAFLLCRLID